MALRYDLLERVVDRCAELATATDCHPLVQRVWLERLKDLANAYLDSLKTYKKAENAWAKENSEAVEALKALDQPFKIARAVVAAYCPKEKLPETLKALPTETEQKNAISEVVEILDNHSTEEWAEEVSRGEFGTKAPVTLQEVNESIAANRAFAEAEVARAAAYGPAWERYLAFKNVVRNVYGPKSKQYRRIHIRNAALVEKDDEGGGQGGGGGGTPA